MSLIRCILSIAVPALIAPAMAGCLLGSRVEPSHALHADLSWAVDQIRPAVVQIVFAAEGLSGEIEKRVGRSYILGTIGTGFLVNGEGHVLTAYHVLQTGQKLVQTDGDMHASRKQLLVGLVQQVSEQSHPHFVQLEFDIIDTDPRHDLALLKLKRNPFRGEVLGPTIGGVKRPLVVATVALTERRPRDGEAIGLSGYPLAHPVLVTKGGWLATVWSLDIRESPAVNSHPGLDMPDVADSYLADIEVNNGNSGGPVFLGKSGEVIGMASSFVRAPVKNDIDQNVSLDGHSLTYSSGLAVIVPSQYIIQLLKKNHAPWRRAE